MDLISLNIRQFLLPLHNPKLCMLSQIFKTKCEASKIKTPFTNNKTNNKKSAQNRGILPSLAITTHCL